MIVDVELIFECLIYLQNYFYAVFATFQLIIIAVKYRFGTTQAPLNSSLRDTNLYIPCRNRDVSVTSVILLADLVKIILYRKFKYESKDLITGVSVLLTLISIFGLLYIFVLQYPVWKLEMILCYLEIMLAITQIVFGGWQVAPCNRTDQYY